MKTLISRGKSGDLYYSQVGWALTPAALSALSYLEDVGIKDRDLALCVLERIWPESEIFGLEEDEDVR